MARVSPIQSNFDAGEFSPLLQARVDADRYKRGLAKCQNAITTIQGPVIRRSGTRFVEFVKNTSGVRLIPFKYSVTGVSIMLEFGNGYVRLYDNSGNRYIGGCTFTVTAANATAGAVYSGVGGSYTVATTIVAGTTLSTKTSSPPPIGTTLNKLSGTGDATITFSAAVEVPFEIASPFDADRLAEMKYTQSLNTLYLMHPLVHPKKLVLASIDPNYTNTIEDVNFLDGPYLNTGLPEDRCVVTSLIHTSKMSTSAATGATLLTTVTGDYTTLAITAIVNNGSGLCRITLADNDEFSNLSQVYVFGATGTTGANGTFFVNKISATQYDLLGSTFNAAYTGSGKIAPAPFSIAGKDVGRLIRIKLGTNPWGYAKITSVVHGALANATVINTTTTTGDTASFKFGVWYEEHYPDCCVFHEDRLWFGGGAGTSIGPPSINIVGGTQRIDGSVSGDYENFAPTDLSSVPVIADSNAVSFTLASNEANSIYSMTSDERGMPVMTAGGPWVIRPSVLSEGITPTNISAKRINNLGAKNTQAVVAGKSTIYIENSSRKVREFSYFYDIDGFRSVDLTEIAEHLPDTGISTELAFQKSPQPVIWCAREDGMLLGLTYDRNLDAIRTGWHKHILGGRSDASGSYPIVKSLAVLPSPDGKFDNLWLGVQRWINGAQVLQIEIMDKIFENFDEQDDAFFVDCGATYDNAYYEVSDTDNFSIDNTSPAVVYTSTAHGLSTGDKVKFENATGFIDVNGVDRLNNIPFVVTVIDPLTFSLDGLDATVLTFFEGDRTTLYRKQITTISGITWLEGETVSILADGAVLPDEVVTGGAITLSNPSFKVQFGLKYSTEIQQLRFEAGAADGTSLGKNRRINEISVMVNRSAAFEIGMAFDTTMNEVVIREPTDPTDTAPPLFSGIKDRIQVDSNYDLDNQLCFRVATPTPFTLLAVMPQQVTYDKG